MPFQPLFFFNVANELQVEQQSSSIAADASNNQENTENEGDILDPNIVSDREASMHVTSWSV